MRLADKIATMARRSAPLPYDAEVAFISGDGAEKCFDTGIIFKRGDEIEIEFRQHAIKDQCSFGVAHVVYAFSNNHDSVTYWAYSPYGGQVTPSVNDTRWHNVVLKDGIGFIDGVEFSMSTIGYDDAIHSIILFGRAANNSILSYTKKYDGDIRKFIYKRNGVVIADYVPCVRDGKAEFYDKATKSFVSRIGDFAWGELDAASALSSSRGESTINFEFPLRVSAGRR